MEEKKKWNLVAAAGFILLALLVVYQTLTTFVREQAVGGGPFANSAFYPQVVAGAMILLAVLLGVSTLAGKSGTAQKRTAEAESRTAVQETPGEQGEAPSERPRKITLLLIALVVVAYTVLLDLFGYFLSTPFMMIALFRLLKVRSWLLTLVVTAAATVTLYAFFSVILDVIFPPGRWNPFIR